MRPIMSSLLRRTFRFSRTSPIASKQQQFFFHSSLVSSPSSSLSKFSQDPSKPTFFLPFRLASTSTAPKKVGADERLTRVIEDEIQCAEESEVRDQAGIIPEGFPFEIIDNPGEQTITLKRELAGETIQVEVHMPQMDGEDEQDNEADKDENDKDDDPAFNIALDVTVVKGDGNRLEFHCVATSDNISIDNMTMKGPEDSSVENAYEGPQFMDLDEALQKSFYEYLEARGIKGSLTNFLQDYMMTKDNREYLTWLKNMKGFVEK